MMWWTEYYLCPIEQEEEKGLNVMEQQARESILINGFCDLVRATRMVQKRYFISHRIPAYGQMNYRLVVGVVNLYTIANKSFIPVHME